MGGEWGDLQLVLERVLLVEEKDDGCVAEAFMSTDRGKGVQGVLQLRLCGQDRHNTVYYLPASLSPGVLGPVNR